MRRRRIDAAMGLCAGVPVLVLCIAGSLWCVPVVSVFQDLMAVIVSSLSRKFGIFSIVKDLGFFWIVKDYWIKDFFFFSTCLVTRNYVLC